MHPELYEPHFNALCYLLPQWVYTATLPITFKRSLQFYREAGIAWGHFLPCSHKETDAFCKTLTELQYRAEQKAWYGKFRYDFKDLLVMYLLYALKFK